MNSDRYFVITGASGAGKSTLLDELRFLGHSTIPEVGRIVVREQLARGGRALPWVDMRAFMDEVLARSIRDHEAASSMHGLVFFDRAVPEASLSEPRLRPDYLAAVARCRYNPRVFVAEPWPEIYVNDAERLQTFETSTHWFEQSTAMYVQAGYELCVIPRGATVRERAEFVLENARNALEGCFSVGPAPFSRPAGHSTDRRSPATPRLQ